MNACFLVAFLPSINTYLQIVENMYQQAESLFSPTTYAILDENPFLRRLVRTKHIVYEMHEELSCFDKWDL